MNTKLSLTILVVTALGLNSCASTPVSPVVPAPTTISPQMPVSILREDISHVVGPGETLWRISKMYDVRMEDIIRANNLRNAEKLEMGQRLLVPQAAPIKSVIPLYPSKKWKYIIIHHSATDIGSALQFFEAHKKRGFWHGLGYHFVIDNGTYDKVDGQIEISPRWIKQQDGAHCKASRMNYKGIGICLVGNFSEEGVSKQQMDSLIYLVDSLKKYYKIPTRNIMGHGRVPRARTECPGKYFPWKEFWLRLR